MASESSAVSVPGGPVSAPQRLLVSVIIPHYNDLANLERCIGLLAVQTMPRDRFEIVVADNNSRCGIDEVRRVSGDAARVVPAPIQGAGPARNAAVAASRGAVLAFIDSDCRPAPNWLERGLAAVSSGGMVGGEVGVDYEDPAHPTAVEAFERVYAFDVRRYVEDIGFGVTANMFVAREIFERVGAFRTGVPEDLDWGKRAAAAGYRWRFGDDVIVTHPARRTWTELTQKWRRLTREAYLAAIEQPNGRIKWLLRSFAVLGSPFVHWVAAARSKKLDNDRQRLMAIGVLFRIRFWRFLEAARCLLGV